MEQEIEKPKLLLVDDRPENLTALQAVLDDLGAEIVLAHSGNEALSKVLKQEFAVVLLDVQMPGMDGFEVAELMRSNEKTRKIPIIFVTAISKEQQYVFKGYESGAVDYLFKPLEPVVVQGKVRIFIELFQALKASEMAQQAAEAANIAKSQFLATMSHEVRTPLNGVIGMNEMLKSTELDYEQNKYVELTRHAAESLLAMLNDVLDFSKIEDGKLTLEEIDFDLRSHIEKMVDIVSPQMLQRGVECISYIPPEVPTYLRGDPTRIRQMVLNLLSNAVKFTDQGTVTVQVELESETEREASLRIMVSDTGIGIPKDCQEQIFQSFVQADASTTRKYGGTGLGLSICRQIIHAMGGEIGVESEEGEGATFWLRLTLPKQENYTPEDIPADMEKLRGKRVLIVDDEQTNRHLFTNYLANGTVCDVDSVSDGYEALEMLQQARLEKNPYDVVLLDNKMPGMSGAELGARIKQDPQLKNLSIVMLTFFSDQGERRRMLEMGFDAYLNKPVRREELIHQLGTLFRKSTRGISSERAAEPASDSATEALKMQPYAHLKILVVDDEPINQFFIKGVLVKKLGCEPAIANNGEQAVEMAREQRYDLIFMDCQMPVMDGYCATEEIRAYERSQQRESTVIFALTGNSSEEDKRRASEAGMDAFLEKPVTSDTILKTISHYLPGVEIE